MAVLTAPGGTGKTTLLLYEAVHIALGTPLYGLEVTSPGRVLFVTAEDTRERLIARARHIIESMDLSDAATRHAWSRLLFWDVAGTVCRLAELGAGGNIALTGLADAIVERYHNDELAMVTFDPAISFGAGERLVNDNEQALILAARRIVRGLTCCVRFVHHTGKANAREKTLDQYSARGGSALVDGARMVTVLQPWNDDDKLQPPSGFTVAPGATAYVLARPKGSYCPRTPLIWITRRGYHFTHQTEVSLDPATQRAAYADQVVTFLTSQLKRTPPRCHTKTSLENEAIMPREKLRVALSDLLVDGKVIEEELPKELRHGGRKTCLKPVCTPPSTPPESDGDPPQDPPDSSPSTLPSNPLLTTPPPYRERKNGGVETPLISFSDSLNPPMVNGGVRPGSGVDSESWVGRRVRHPKLGHLGTVLAEKGTAVKVRYDDGHEAWPMRGEVALVEEAPIEGKPDLPAVAPIEGEVLGAEDSPIAAGAKASGASLPARTVTAALPWMRNWRTREVCHVEREEGGECQVYYPALNLRARVRSDELRSLSAESLTAVMARFGP